MAFFGKDDLYTTVTSGTKDEVTLDEIGNSAISMKVTNAVTSILRGIFKTSMAWRYSELPEFVMEFVEDEDMAEDVIDEVREILETMLDDDKRAYSKIENLINGEDDEYHDALDAIHDALADEEGIDIEEIVLTHGVTLDSTAYPTLGLCRSGRFDKSKQKCFKSADKGKKAFRRETIGKDIRPYQKNKHIKNRVPSPIEKKRRTKSMKVLGYVDGKGKYTEKFLKKLRKKRKVSSDKKTSKANRG